MPSALEDAAGEFRAALLAQERAAASEMVRAYGASWQRVRAQLDGLQLAMRAAQDGGADATALLHQQRRLLSLERQIAIEMRDFAALAGDLTEAGQLQAVQAAISNSAALIQTAQQAAGLPLVFDRLPVEAVQEFIGFASNGSPLRTLFDALGDDVSRGIRDELAAAIAAGRNPRETAREIRRLYSMGMQRALVIARTEQIRAYREATHQTYLRNADVLDGWIWLSAANRRTCAACWAMHGTFHPLKERVDGHPNCVVSGTIINSPSVLATSKRWFDGEVIEISTINGNVLTVTKNHPVLTDQGWVAAHLLKEGDYVVSSLDSERTVTLADPNDYARPTLIEDVIKTFVASLSVFSVSVPGSTEDFHGDGINGNVSVIGSNRFLDSGYRTAFDQPITQDFFIPTTVQLPLLTRQRGFAFLLESPRFAFRPFVHRGNHFLDFFGTSLLAKQSIGLGLSADWNTHFEQMTPDYVSRDAVLIGNDIFGLTGDVIISDLLRQIDTDGLVGRDSALAHFSVESGASDVIGGANVFTASSAQIQLDRVVNVAIKQFSGHVYNLQTSTGWYVANNIITHNCRCTQVPVVKGHKPTTKDGEELFRLLPEVGQRAVLGAGAWEAWKAGAVNLAQFAGQRSDLEWGTMRYRRSLREILGRTEALRWIRQAQKK